MLPLNIPQTFIGLASNKTEYQAKTREFHFWESLIIWSNNRLGPLPVFNVAGAQSLRPQTPPTGALPTNREFHTQH